MKISEAEACLKTLRDLANKIAAGTGTYQIALDVAEAFCDLDRHLAEGGVPPSAWRPVKATLGERPVVSSCPMCRSWRS